MRKTAGKIVGILLCLTLLVGTIGVGLPQTVLAAGGRFTSVGGWNETIYAQISGISKSDVTGVSYSGTMNGQLTGEDFTYLVRDLNGGVRIDIPGMKPGTYTLTVATNGGTLQQDGIVVEAQDRSGYAHFNYTEGVGAYNDDGTLKDNAIVLYVTNENKNTVTLSACGVTVSGIGNILNSVAQDAGGGKNANGGTANTNQDILRKLARADIPLVVRIIGTVSDSTSADIKTNDINGLTVWNSVDMGGSVKDNGHMARMRSGKNITIEGIGYDAVIDGWGFHFMCSSGDADLGKSFEVRNLTFINTPEDAVGMEGVQASESTSSEITASVERCWVHNNSFYVPHISNPAESDKAEGDGSVDFKRGQYFTCSYNYFEGCHKTNLVGSAETSLQYNLTYHHNYWKYCKARGPLARNANIHMYNNVFEGQTDYAMNTRADAYIFSEYNLFYMCKGPQAVESGAIKSYKDSFSSYLLSRGVLGTIVADKSEQVSNNCQYQFGGIDYSSFETSDVLSYIPSGKYFLQENVTEAKKVVYASAGVMKQNPFTAAQVSMSDISMIPGGVTPVEITDLPAEKTKADIGTNGKLSKTVYAFTVYTDVDIEVAFASETLSATGVLVNEAGEAFLVGSGTARSLPAGTYMVQSANFESGDSTKLGTFKDLTVQSIKITSADPNYDPNALRGISLNERTATMLVNATKQLTVSYQPSNTTADKTVTWTSSDDSVASVSGNGLITAKKIGTATITATVAGTFTAACNVTVSEPVAINGVMLSADSLTLTVGSKETLTAAAVPENTTEQYTVNWKSSDSSVASVDKNGTVSAVAEGSTVITAQITGSKGTFSASCAVTVEKAPQLPAGDMAHNFTTDGTTSNFYQFAGDYPTTKSGDVTYNGVTLQKALKFDSKGKTTFTAPSKGTLTLVFSPKNANNKIDVNGKVITLDASGIVTMELPAGAVTVKNSSKESHLYYIAFVPEGGSGGDEHVVAITGITIDRQAASLKVNESIVLNAVITPDNTTQSKSVNWKSSNPQAATVSNGKVTAVGAGTAVITATCAANSSFSASCTITVSVDSSGGNQGGNQGGNTGGEPGSVELVHSFVDRLYNLALGRQPDEGGKNSWSSALLENRSSGVNIGYGFVFSDECKNNNLSNTEFVEMLYNVFMDRPSDEGGRNAWVSQLDAGVEREKVLEGFLFSQEFSEICSNYGIIMGTLDDEPRLREAIAHNRNRNANLTKFVSRCYTQTLGRKYEEDGLEAWCGVILAGSNTPKQVAKNFIFSDEFTQKNTSNEEYVKVLYRTFLGREADEGGLAAWTEVLDSGREDRDKVLSGFADSVEFSGILQSFGLN